MGFVCSFVWFSCENSNQKSNNSVENLGIREKKKSVNLHISKGRLVFQILLNSIRQEIAKVETVR